MLWCFELWILNSLGGKAGLLLGEQGVTGGQGKSGYYQYP